MKFEEIKVSEYIYMYIYIHTQENPLMSEQSRNRPVGMKG